MMMSNTNRRILVVDDNESIHDDFRKILLKRESCTSLSSLEEDIFGKATKRESALPSFELDFAFQGHDGFLEVQRAKKMGLPYALAFIDVRMPPGWDGVETAEKILEVDPDIQIVFCTAFTDYDTSDILQRFGVSDNVVVLRKPFDASEVELLAVSLTQKWQVNDEMQRVARSQSDTLSRATRILDEVQQANEKLLDEKLLLERDTAELEIALRNTTQKLGAAEDLTLCAMASVVEARDAETGEHIRRMQAIAQLIAQRLSEFGPYQSEIDERFLRTFYHSTPLHDIGKVGIPDEILLKPGRLSLDEFEAMKHHTCIGYEILNRTAGHEHGSFFRMAATIARHHHERWDGTGYPDGLAGSAIPLPARIACVADSFDAITSIRVYKKAKSNLEGKQIILEESGKQFDPHVVEAFIAVFSEVCEAQRQINERTMDQVMV